jgi:hypothetical protein
MEERLLREIQKSNPWWFDKKEKVPTYKRRTFSEISRYLRLRQIIAVIGLRRVGKTILMKQLIHGLSAKPENILFFSFEEKWGKSEILEDFLYYFLENMAGEERKYIFLDEIQKVKGWEDVLKRFYDRHEDIKFIVSGSASIYISKSIESLAGRIFDVYVPPLTFMEFLEMNGIKINTDGACFEYKTLGKIYTQNLYLKEKIVNFFDEYLFKGGFPEIVKEEDEEIVRRYIANSVVERILLKDLPEEYKIKKLEALREILEYAARETSGIFVIDKMSSLLNLNKETVSNYVEYLKRAFLLHVVYNYTKSAAKQIRTSKKVHIVLPSVAIALEYYDRNVLLYPEITGKYVESLIAVFLSYRYKKIFFWRTPQKDEVDIVIKEEEMIPIEVKYKSQIAGDDIKSLLKFCKKFKIKRGILVTRDLFDAREIEGIEILYVPAWLFLLTI